MSPEKRGVSLAQALRESRQSSDKISTLDARLLLQQAVRLSYEEIVANPDDLLSSEQYQEYRQLLRRRAGGEPVSQILQHKEFWGLPFKVTDDVLTPRPDTETIVELALDLCGDRPPQTVLDIGTGSGCLLAALLTEFPEAAGVGLDISDAALKIATENIAALGLGQRTALRQADFNQQIDGPYDLIVSNPPYIPEEDRDSLPVEVRDFEPAEALFAGDGFDAYKSISGQLPHLLSERGVFVLEAGAGQADEICNLVRAAFKNTNMALKLTIRADLAGINRAVGGQILPKKKV